MLAWRAGPLWLEEGADVSFVHEVGTDETGEGEWAGHGILGGLGQSQDQEGDEGDGDLSTNGILGGSEEAGDLEGLLDPAKEQLDCPSQFVEIGDLLSWRGEIVGEDAQDFAGIDLDAQFADRLSGGQLVESDDARVHLSAPPPPAAGDQSAVRRDGNATVPSRELTDFLPGAPVPNDHARLIRRCLLRYYVELRLNRARLLLLQTNLSVIDVALACGFVSPSHFSKCYRDFFGKTPRKERSLPPRLATAPLDAA